ncbi:MAG: riboflavin biosynthesis protein RibF [Oscillospiraceae bacterium]|nr:riboflavin biosynthesis protein RibF [Oscillospiraceae bacterium]MDD4367499.1 riboflavin biosynthesis protein RibF [Oscillospiraceae bacterium]
MTDQILTDGASNADCPEEAIYTGDLLQEDSAWYERYRQGGPYVAALGFFDGVHRGHRVLLDRMLCLAAQLQLTPLVFSFDILPQKLDFDFKETHYHGLLQQPASKAALLLQLGAGRVVDQHYTDAFRRLSPEAFLNDILYQGLGVRCLVIGENFRFGYQRRGTPRVAAEWGRQKGVQVEIVRDLSSEAEPVSTRRIKNFLQQGKVEAASRLMGHDFSMIGPVIRGHALGRTAGMPTANVAVSPLQFCPPYGVYATRTRVGSRIYPSISNIGVRPTVNKVDTVPLLETFILGYEMDLYDQEIEVFFVSFLRPEETFPSFLTMTTQIHEDIQNARDYQASCERLELIEDRGGMPYYHLPSRRFNTSLIKIIVRHRITPARAAAYALLARLLQTGQDYPTHADLVRETVSLYGSRISCHISAQTDLLTLTFTGESVKSGLEGSQPFRKLQDILFMLLIKPLLDEAGLFQQDFFELEKRNLIAELAARRQDTGLYSLERALSLLWEGQAPGLGSHGSAAEISRLTREQVTLAWQELLQQARIEVYTAGDLGQDTIDAVVANLHRFPAGRHRLVPRPGLLPGRYQLPAPRLYREFKEVEQPRAVLIYGDLPAYYDPDAAAADIMNEILGGVTHSLLFDQVREKHAYAYHISSSLRKYPGLLIIQAGITPGQMTAALDTIKSCVASLQQGSFEDELFMSAKRLVKNELIFASDDLELLLNFLINEQLSGLRRDLAEAIAEVNQTGKAEIKQLAGQLTLGVTFLLQPDPASAALPDSDKRSPS